MKSKKENQESTKKFDFFSLGKIKDDKLETNSKTRWTEETFINYSDKEIKKSDKIFFGLSIDAKIIKVFLIIVLCGLGILMARSVQLQIVKGEEYLSVAEQNRLRVHYIRAPRGIIYDRNGTSLVSNVPNFLLLITPFDFPKNKQAQDEIITTLENFLQADLSEPFNAILQLDSRRREYFEPLLIYEDIDYEAALQLDIITSNVPGVSVAYDTKRQYIFNQENEENEFLYNSLSHIIGYEGKLSQEEYDSLSNSGYLLNDRIGKNAIELSYENALRGKHGRKQIEVDSQGKEKKIIAKDDPERGKGLVLTIDLNMQNKMEELIRTSLLENGKSRGVGIAINPQNGEVLAIVSLPSYNNNYFATGIEADKYNILLENEDKPLFNRAIHGEYPSGSTIKPVIASAALEEGLVDEHTSFISSGGIRIGEWFFPDWRAGGHGVTNVRKAIADSVNTYFYTVGGGHGDFEGLGVDKIRQYGELFGLSQPTGVDLVGEKSGLLPTPEWKFEKKGEQWYIGDTYHLAIGQGDLLVTPLQVANFTSIFANGGIFFKPHLVKTFLNPETGEEINNRIEKVRENFIDQYNIEVVRQGLRQAVTSGSARILNSLPVSAGAKTGTAEWGTDKDPHAWFTCFAPYENSEIAVTILIEEGEEGSKISAQLAYEFLRWYFREYENKEGLRRQERAEEG